MAAFFHSQLLAALWWTSLLFSPWGETFLTVKLVQLRKHGRFCYYNNSRSKITAPLQGFKTHINLFSQDILYMQLKCRNHNSLWILTSVWSSVRYFKSEGALVWTYLVETQSPPKCHGYIWERKLKVLPLRAILLSLPLPVFSCLSVVWVWICACLNAALWICLSLCLCVRP